MALSDRPILMLDIDGVVAGGNYIPEWDRHPEVYESLPLLEDRVIRDIYNIGREWYIYYVSSRRYDGALSSTRRWLIKRLGLLGVAGTLVGVHPLDRKREMAQLLHADLLVDDCPEVVLKAPCPAILKVNPNYDKQWGGIEEAKKVVSWVDTWSQLVDRIGVVHYNWMKAHNPQYVIQW